MPGPVRNHLIDRLRGLSILVVLFLHSSSYLPVNILPTIRYYVARNGYYGVSIFFVISGYLIANHSIERYGALSRTRILDFYVTRSARLLPPLILMIIVVSLLYGVGLQDYRRPITMNMYNSILHLFMFDYNWYELRRAGLPAWMPMWSLSVEGVSYVLFPLVCRLCWRDRFLCIPLAAAIIAGPFYRQDWGHTILWSGCVDQMAMGCVVALLATKPFARTIPRWATNLLLLSGISLISCIYLVKIVNEFYIPGPSLVGLGAALFVMGTAFGQKDTPPLSKLACLLRGPYWLLEQFGKTSYELYLFHVAGLVTLRGLVSDSAVEQWGPVLIVAFPLVALLFASGVSRFYSEPLNLALRAYLRRKTVKSTVEVSMPPGALVQPAPAAPAAGAVAA